MLPTFRLSSRRFFTSFLSPGLSCLFTTLWFLPEMSLRPAWEGVAANLSWLAASLATQLLRHLQLPPNGSTFDVDNVYQLWSSFWVFPAHLVDVPWPLVGSFHPFSVLTLVGEVRGSNICFSGVYTLSGLFLRSLLRNRMSTFNSPNWFFFLPIWVGQLYLLRAYPEGSATLPTSLPFKVCHRGLPSSLILF